MLQTGGGKDYFPPDEIHDRVASILDVSCYGLDEEIGGDAVILNNSIVESGSFANVASDGDQIRCEEIMISDVEICNMSTNITNIAPVQPKKKYFSNAGALGMYIFLFCTFLTL